MTRDELCLRTHSTLRLAKRGGLLYVGRRLGMGICMNALGITCHGEGSGYCPPTYSARQVSESGSVAATGNECADTCGRPIGPTKALARLTRGLVVTPQQPPSALERARCLTPPAVLTTETGHLEQYQFWDEHAQLLSEAWEEYGRLHPEARRET